MFLFAYYLPDKDQSNGYDDYAICRAWTKNQAIRKFKKLYAIVNDNTVKRIKYNKYGIAIISDY